MSFCCPNGPVRPAALALAACAATIVAAQADQSEEYRRVVTGRAEKIVDPMGIDDSAQRDRVVELIADQYVALSEAHDSRDQRLASGDEHEAAVRDASHRQVVELHRKFVAALYAELSHEQVEAVKDGMTYGVLPNTYRGYLRLIPSATDEQKRMIHANLIEAREHAMDAGSSKEKHGWFGKYKGRINNRLSADGIDLKQAERDLAARSVE